MVEEFLLSIEIVHSDFAIMKNFGELKAFPSRRGRKLSGADLLVAATVLCNDGLPVIGTVKRFNRIPGLETEHWLV